MPLLNRNKSKSKQAAPEGPGPDQEPEVQYVGYDDPIDPAVEGSVTSIDSVATEPVSVDTSNVSEAIQVEMAAMEESFQKQWSEYKTSAKYSDDKQDTTDNVLDNVVEVGVSEGCIDPCDNSESSKGDSTMAVPAEIHEQNLARLAGAGAQAHEHFVQFGKILDLSYEQDRKMVSLVESLGVREVTSQAGQTGIPLAGGRAQ